MRKLTFAERLYKTFRWDKGREGKITEWQVSGTSRIRTSTAEWVARSRGRRSQTVGADCLTVCHPRDLSLQAGGLTGMHYWANVEPHSNVNSGIDRQKLPDMHIQLVRPYRFRVHLA